MKRGQRVTEKRLKFKNEQKTQNESKGWSFAKEKLQEKSTLINKLSRNIELQKEKKNNNERKNKDQIGLNLFSASDLGNVWLELNTHL